MGIYARVVSLIMYLLLLAEFGGKGERLSKEG
jgi:hypothetical protein